MLNSAPVENVFDALFAGADCAPSRQRWARRPPGLSTLSSQQKEIRRSDKSGFVIVIAIGRGPWQGRSCQSALFPLLRPALIESVAKGPA
jgi:hypothetical protein